jgi:hypothetical protein
MTSSSFGKPLLVLMITVLAGCPSQVIPEITYDQPSSALIKFSDCKWHRLNLICRVDNLTDQDIAQRGFTISAFDASGEVVFEELIKTPIDASSHVEKWFTSFKSRERVVRLGVEKIQGRR